MRTYDEWIATEPDLDEDHPVECLCPDCDPDGDYSQYEAEDFRTQEQLEAAVRAGALRALDLK